MELDRFPGLVKQCQIDREGGGGGGAETLRKSIIERTMVLLNGFILIMEIRNFNCKARHYVVLNLTAYSRNSCFLFSLQS